MPTPGFMAQYGPYENISHFSRDGNIVLDMGRPLQNLAKLCLLCCHNLTNPSSHPPAPAYRAVCKAVKSIRTDSMDVLYQVLPGST